VVLVLVPCTVIVLRRPNEGEMPAWVDRWIARVPVPRLLRRSA
jgi:hypothetical protein